MTPHLQESTLVDTCLQYQISTTDFQVNLLCSSKETSIFEYVNLLSGKPLTKFNQLILEAALRWTALVERNSLAAQRPNNSARLDGASQNPFDTKTHLVLLPQLPLMAAARRAAQP